MSKSRLEKFLYALYSLDSSDLPTPLSRIEELYKCLVTGEEAPTFKPLSRVEKYLMAILGVYDIDSLPNPLSRVEVLLYKLATGDDNLDDFKSFLSEHEELLAEIIRNRGVGGNIDIEYVLYSLSTKFNTFYNTAKKPVKSAILKGNTLVNISPSNGEITLAPASVQFIDISSIKSNTIYTISFNCSCLPSTNFMEFGQVFDNTALKIDNIPIIQGYNRFKVTTVNKELNRFRFKNDSTSETDFIFNNLMILEGDYTNVDIPYFEGMQSVKMPVLTTTGKNLFDGIMTRGQLQNNNAINNNQTKMGYSEFLHIEEELDIYCSYYTNSTYVIEKIYFYDENKNQISSKNTPTKVTSPKGAKYFRFSITTTNWYSNVVFDDIKDDFNIQVETGIQATSYEPYKSNILTVNEDVVLCGIGDVQDELDLKTGEVTKRVGEVVFNGTEDWTRSSHAANSPLFYTSFNNLVHKGDYRNSVICDKLMVYANHEDLYYLSNSPNGISAYYDYYDTYPNENWIYIKYADSEGYVEKLKQWLSQNPITVQYELATESVKTVDLSVVDQDGNNTKLSTFNDITHVTLSSEGLIPEAELEVATKNEEVLNTMSLEMDDISTIQNTLKETSNAQGENVDATMIATTEIYERLL